MTLDEFTQQIEMQDSCPSGLPPALKALWYDKKGDWDKAHQIVQDASDQDSAWVHAYLHRKEGDLSNADYWYRRSGRSALQQRKLSHFPAELSQEWELLTRDLLLKI